MTNVNYISAAKEIKKKLSTWDYGKQKEHAITGETASRVSLVDPFLAILGYKLENDDVRHEYTVEVNSKKLKVDTVIVDGKARLPIILIECKRTNVALNDNHLRQLREYLDWVPESKLGILTNGLYYQFYLKGQGTSFLSFNIKTIHQPTLERLAAFHRNNFNFNEFKVLAEEYYFVEQFENALADELKAPSPDVLKAIYRRMGGKRFDEKVEIRLNELFNSFSLQGAVDKLRESESRNAKLGIITTQEELTAFSVIRAILATSGKVKPVILDRIGYRDYKGHFSILVDDSQAKCICTLALIGKKTLKIDLMSQELEDPIEVSLSKHKREIVDSALRLNDSEKPNYSKLPFSLYST